MGLKNLKDVLLEFAVLNTDLLFDSNRAAVSTFSRYVLEEILQKSKDMCWPISLPSLVPFAYYTKMPKSRPLDLCGCTMHPLIEAMEIFERGNLAVKAFKASLTLDESTDADVIRKFKMAADRLEGLDLVVNTGVQQDGKKSVQSTGASSRPLRLKRMKLTIRHYEMFPFALDPDWLTVFELYDCILTRNILETLTGFKRLVHLSLWNVWLKDFSKEEAIDAAVALKELRYFSFDEWVNELLLDRIHRDMENLETLELRVVILRDRPRGAEEGRRRKLKVLNIDHLIVNRTLVSPVEWLNGLAHRVGHSDDPEGVMTVISTTSNEFLLYRAIYELFRYVHDARRDGVRMPTVDASKFKSPLSLTETFRFGLSGGITDEVLLRLACYMLNSRIIIGHYPRKWIKDFVKRINNTHLAKKIAELLEIET